MSSALSSTRSIALSYGTMKKPKPVTEDLYDPAHALSAKIISHLWLNWGSDPQGLRPSKEIDLCAMPFFG
jgi:tubulin--tyrosine ligase